MVNWDEKQQIRTMGGATPASREERIQETLKRAGLPDVRIVSLVENTVMVAANDYTDYVLARQELRGLGLVATRA